MSLNVLIVDDSPIIRSILEKTLRIAQIPVTNCFKAENGAVALEILDKEWIDLMFLDINMPVMNGVETVQQMKERDLLKSTPVVIISTEGSATRIQQLMDQGVSGYLRKPFKPEDLSRTVNEILGAIDA